MNPTVIDPYPVIHNEKERIRALETSARSYPQDMPCLHCGYRWMQHMGTICPEKQGMWSKVVGPDGHPIPIPPSFGNRLFVPDEMYYDQNPDFDVV